ncbi:hypothetical protein [Leptospira harrisiae]|uniref:hypothetical protein n=1 Tax=Leptospira harrisiae TaxID=2023189 RepID=UPI000C2B3487|nr:hypothetical protein [Leptospira harrisiae]PKA06505.1 hypothetical protein CH366_18855 [Leptospira harrisiae]
MKKETMRLLIIFILITTTGAYSQSINSIKETTIGKTTVVSEEFQAKYIDMVAITEKIHNFYELAWQKLIFFVSTAFIILGLLIPILTQIYQKRDFVIKEKELLEKIKSELTVAKTEITKSQHEFIETTLNEKIGEIESRFNKRISEAEETIMNEVFKAKAGLFHIQGNFEMNFNIPILAARSYMLACDEHLKVTDDLKIDELNLRRILKELTNSLLLLDRNELLKDEPLITEIYPRIIDLLKEKDINGKFTDPISEIQRSLKIAQSKDNNQTY